MRQWDASALPFLEEKELFRLKCLRMCERYDTALCLFAGAQARLTRIYAERFNRVWAVDISLPPLPTNVCRIEMKMESFLEKPERWLPDHLDVLDIDPYGSSMPVLKEFLDRVRGSIGMVILTEGALTSVRLRRRINLYKHYGLNPDAPVKPERWHYEMFPSLVFARIKELVQAHNYSIKWYGWEYNRYKMALYACAQLGGEA